MKIEISLSEVQEFLSSYYNINVGLKNIGVDKIEANYLVSFILTIKEVRKDEVLFKYEVNSLVDLLAKGAHFLKKKNLMMVLSSGIPRQVKLLLILRRFRH